MILQYTAVLFVLFYYANGVYHYLNDSFDEDIEVTISTRKPRSHVFAELSSVGSDSGTVQVYLPNVTSPREICYPTTYLQNSEASKLLHVLCKQLGHVTYDVRYENPHTTAQRPILSTSAQCTGREDDVSECPWGNVKTKKCEGVLATRCSSCNYKYSASRGAVHNPGFPHTYLYSLICEWSIQISEDEGIELYFQEFSLPRADKDECDSYVELTYGDQKSPTHDRLCPADKVTSIKIPFKSVRIRFASGFFQPVYEKQHVHYGLHISYTNVPVGVSSSSITKLAIVTGAIILFAIVAICCYFCQYYVKVDKNNTGRNHTTFILPPNAPTQEELQEAFDFQRRAMQVPQGEEHKKSDNSSTESYLSRWRSKTNLPVTSALAPIGPDTRRVSIATTPRSVFPESCRKWSEESARRIEKLRTRLIARFSTTSRLSASDVSVFLPPSERRSYTRLSCEEDIPLNTLTYTKSSGTSEASSSKVPDIVVEFVT